MAVEGAFEDLEVRKLRRQNAKLAIAVAYPRRRACERRSWPPHTL
jgi:hypothetical protein